MAMNRCPGVCGGAVAVWAWAVLGSGAAGAERPDPAILSLTREVTAIEQQLIHLADPNDTGDSLFFDWLDEPYGRATLACAGKTVRILEREIVLRQAGSAALRDRQLRGILDWLRAAPTRARNSPHRAGFLPHRRRISLDAISSDPAPALFGFVDRSTVTRLDDWYADTDVLAACGFRVVARADRPRLSPEAWRSLQGHAKALGLALVQVSDGIDAEGRESAPAGVLYLQPRTLREWMSGENRIEGSVLIDPPHGETWGESLARRALYRGQTGGRGAWVSGWTVPETRSNGSATATQIRAAMWVHALDGQRLGLLEGWRDLRDGSASPYASLAATPDVVEAVAHTALDLLYFDPIIRLFSSEIPVALIVGDDALASTDPNRWSPTFGRMAQELFEANVRFDVLPRAVTPQRKAQYVLACEVRLPPDGEPGLDGIYRLGQAREEAPHEHESLTRYLERRAGPATAGTPDRSGGGRLLPIRAVGGRRGLGGRRERQSLDAAGQPGDLRRCPNAGGRGLHRRVFPRQPFQRR